jgi:hypothetical protein
MEMCQKALGLLLLVVRQTLKLQLFDCRRNAPWSVLNTRTRHCRRPIVIDSLPEQLLPLVETNTRTISGTNNAVFKTSHTKVLTSTLKVNVLV